jgi:glycerophosphoryl diester phosphodiesterase
MGAHERGIEVAKRLGPGIGLLCLLAAAPATAQKVATPGVIAHRGVALEAPENTLPAIAKAIELGCAMAEIDLRYTADGEVVVFHDATVERTTDGTGRVADKTLSDLRSLDAGVRMDAAFRGTRVPTFREVVDLSRGKIQLYLDLKETDPRPVVRLVERLEARSMVVYRPYSFGALQQILAETPSARVLVDLGDWVQTPRLLEPLRSAFPTAALSSDWQNWTPPVLAEASTRDGHLRQRPGGERHAREPEPGPEPRVRLHPDRSSARPAEAPP